MKDLITDWTFWAVVVSVIALVLSQLPPVRLWLKAPELTIELYSRIFLTHNIGNPSLQMHIIVSNTGGKSVRVKAINATFTRDGSAGFTLPALSFYQNASDKDTLIFTPFSLGPDQEWSHVVNFLNLFNRDDDRRFRDMASVLRQDIFEKRKAAPDTLVEADQANVQPILAFFAEKFRWLPGEYRLDIEVVGDKATTSKRIRFIIFESESQELRSHSDDYKYGARVYWEPTGSAPKGIFIQIQE